ncbi:MAG: ABC transporter permease [Verrucomicrobiales bacterium]|nr:ABC transporter permease [Verrucomicrobiales bacterium]
MTRQVISTLSADARPRLTPFRRATHRFLGNRAGMIGAVLALGLGALIFSSPIWWPTDPNQLSEAQFAAPSAQHWLGTDANGRDVLARVCAGARVSLWVGFAGALVSLGIGVTWGAVAGYAGGRVDAVMMRCVDVLYSLPSVIFFIVVLTALADGVKAWASGWFGAVGESMAPVALLVLGLGSISWLTMSRIVRAQVRSLRAQPFVEASRSLGAGHGRLLIRHVLRNTTGVIVAYWTLTIPTILLAESFLSYLGLGIQPPRASLGSLLADGAGQINAVRSYAWLLLGPGGVLVTLLLALGFAGDALRDALVPQDRRS